MSEAAYLILEDGEVFQGEFFGAVGEVIGEIVFTTGMTGYLETLTDQSYHGQIVLQTFPLIGNYGVIPQDFESDSIGPMAYIVKHPCQDPSNFRSEGGLGTFLKAKGLVAMAGVDTRALTRRIREKGVMNAMITNRNPGGIDLEQIKYSRDKNPVEMVSGHEPELLKSEDPKYKVVLLDFGARASIKKALLEKRCDVWVMPWNSSPKDIFALNPDGVILSNGPGDPTDNMLLAENIRKILRSGIPTLGIGLGHQLMALANGFKTEKLKYGHRGANQPVKDAQSGEIYITSQNHGFAVMTGTLDYRMAEPLFINANDGSCEGIAYLNAPALSVAFLPQSWAGPRDTGFLFDRLIQMMEEHKYATR